MGWGFKPVDELFRSGSDLWVTPDALSPTGGHQRTIEEDHAVAAHLALESDVPEPVRDYYDATRMIWVYGNLYYPFFSIAAVHAGLCIDLALKARFNLSGVTLPKHEQNLPGRLRYAVGAGWLLPDGFSAVRNRKAERDFLVEARSNSGLSQSIPEVDESDAGRARALAELIDAVRRLRNLHAHPDALMLVLPNWSLAQLQFTRELIHQLFASSSSR